MIIIRLLISVQRTRNSFLASLFTKCCGRVELGMHDLTRYSADVQMFVGLPYQSLKRNTQPVTTPLGGSFDRSAAPVVVRQTRPPHVVGSTDLMASLARVL
jgi:hypothetical protein